MAYIPRSSLIPNEASSAIPVQMKKRRTIHVFGLLATLIFVLSLLTAVGVFVYKDLLGKRLDEAQAQLSEVSNEDSRNMIEEIRIYDEKLKIAKDLLDHHIAPSLIFEELENSTKSTVQFTSMEFVHDPGFDAMLTLTGNTEEFNSLALQKMQIFEDSLFSEFVLQDIGTSQSGEEEDAEVSALRDGVNFAVVGIFRKEILGFGNDLEQRTGNSEAPVEVAPVDVAPAPTPAPESLTPPDAAVPATPVGNPFIEEGATP